MATKAASRDKKASPALKVPAAEIECGKSYSLKRFRKITGFTFETVRQLRARGLRVTKVGSEHWIRGDDYHAYLGQQPTVDESRAHAAAPVPQDQSESTSQV